MIGQFTLKCPGCSVDCLAGTWRDQSGGSDVPMVEHPQPVCSWFSALPTAKMPPENQVVHDDALEFMTRSCRGNRP